ncbi:MAG TPA: pitrilysin family protein [Stellaceae bacterium]|nr:pitrilysin family protein [Stellaceae bacterium]
MRALGLILSAGLLVSAAEAEAGQFNAETFTLTNGLQVVVVPSHRTPAVTQMVWYKAGAADEAPGKSGIAHFVEHLMFRGSKAMPPGAFSRTIAENGGRDNAFTTEDYTAYYQTVASDRLELVMRLEAERMHDLLITEEQVKTEREVIIEERRTRIDNVPSALLSEQIDAVLFLNSHYRLPTIGWQHEMRGLSADDARSFYQTWYAPNNAVVVISGDVTVERVRELAEKYYGPVPTKAVPEHPVLTEPPKVASTRLEMTSPRAANPYWSRSYLAPTFIEQEGRPADVATVLAELLGGGESSRLYKRLVLDKKLATSVGADYSGERNAGSFSIYAEPREGVDIATLEAAVTAEVAVLLRDGASAEEVTRVKRRLRESAIYDRDSLMAPARIIGSSLASGRTLAAVEAWPERIGTVTPDELLKLARDIIKDETAVTAILLPEKRS